MDIIIFIILLIVYLLGVYVSYMIISMFYLSSVINEEQLNKLFNFIWGSWLFIIISVITVDIIIHKNIKDK